VYKSLQACRAAAALSVVLYHLGAQLALAKTFGIAWFGEMFRFGRAGVDFFFVLSGFIVVTAHRNDFFQPARLLSYIRKRVTRIYPTYWLIFIATCCLAMTMRSTRAMLPHHTALIAKSIALLPLDSAVVGGTGAPVIVTAWSLQYELVFYALIGLFIFGRWTAALAVVAMLANALLCVNACTFPSTFFASPYFLLFALGAAVAFLCRAVARVSHPLVVAGLGGLAFALTAVIETVTLAPLGSRASMVAYGLSTGVVIFGLVKAEDIGQVVGGHRSIQLLGDSSYSLYLLHFPVLSILCKAAMASGLRDWGGALVTFAFVLIGCVASGIFLHLWMEGPLLRLLSSTSRPAHARKVTHATLIDRG
jgi:exopolysaccharide production protein ExoZ